MPDQKPYRIKSYSLPVADVEFVDALAWSRRVPASSVIAWALQILREALDKSEEAT